MLTIPPNANSESIDKSLVITQEQQLKYAIQVASGLVRLKCVSLIPNSPQ